MSNHHTVKLVSKEHLGYLNSGRFGEVLGIFHALLICASIIQERVQNDGHYRKMQGGYYISLEVVITQV
jgi:hypothetical protein